LGTILTSDEERTAIDFVQHGTKKFVTSMVVLELTDEQPQRKAKKPARRAAKAKK
jgi:predicted secreted protein